MTSTDNADQKLPEPKEELKRFISRFEDLRQSDEIIDNSHLIASLNTFSQKIVLDSITRENVFQRLDYLNKQTTIALQIENPDNEIRNILNSAYSDVILFLREMVERGIPITYKLPKPVEGKKNKTRNILEKMFYNKKNMSVIMNNESIVTDVEPFDVEPSGARNGYKMSVFISHRFTQNDIELAVILKKLLKTHNIYGYIAETRPEFNLRLDEKIQNEIRNSHHVVGIITNESANSPSVNQELGYALGRNISLIIMVEKNVKHGVLTESKEIQEFTRENFEQYCKRVIGYILENDIPEKISEEDRKELVKNVYDPCYDGIMQAYKDREFITYIHNNPWDKITPAWKLRTDKSIASMFENYSRELEKWSRMYVNFGNQFQTNQQQLGEILKSIFQKVGLMNENGQIKFADRTLTPSNWLYNCQDVIFNDSISNGDDLYEILTEHTKRRWGDEYHLNYEKWKKEIPQIYAEIQQIIPELIKTLNAKFTYQQLSEQRSILKKQIEELKNALEEKLK